MKHIVSVSLGSTRDHRVEMELLGEEYVIGTDWDGWRLRKTASNHRPVGR